MQCDLRAVNIDLSDLKRKEKEETFLHSSHSMETTGILYERQVRGFGKQTLTSGCALELETRSPKSQNIGASFSY